MGDDHTGARRIADHKVLQKILRTEAGLLKVQRWLERHAPEEASIPQFWYDVQVFHRLKTPEELRIAALEVCAGYLNHASADRLVSISRSVSQTLVDHVQDAGTTFFERAQQEVFWRLNKIIESRPDSFAELITQVTSQSDGEGQLHFNSRTARELDATRVKARYKSLLKALASNKDTVSVRRIPSHGTERLRYKHVMRFAPSGSDGSQSEVNALKALDRRLGTMVTESDPCHNMLLAHCDVWDYADLCTDDIIGIETGVHTFHRKISKKDEEHPMLFESRRRAEKCGKLWTPSNSKHDGLKSAVIAANEHIATSPPVLMCGSPGRPLRVVFRDGSILSYSVGSSGRLADVILDTTLQGKVREYGGLTDACFTKAAIFIQFAGINGLSRLRLDSKGVPQLDYGTAHSGGSSPRGGSTPRLDRKHGGSTTAVDPAARRGGFISVHPSGTLAATWWPHPTVNMTPADNVVLSHISVTPTFASKVVQRFQTAAEIVAVFWGTKQFELNVVTVEISPIFDSVVTLKVYAVADPRGDSPGTHPAGSKGSSQLSVPGAPSAVVPTRAAPPRTEQSITVVMAGTTSLYAMCPVSGRLLVVGQYGRLALVDVKEQDTISGDSDLALPTAAAWHPDGAVIAIASPGHVHLFDAMLAPLRASLVGEAQTPQPSLRLPIHAEPYQLVWTTTGGPPAPGAPCNALAVGAVECPVMVIEFLVKGPSAHFMRYRWAIKSRLAAGQGQGAVKLLSRLDWRNNIAASFQLLADVVNHFLALPFSPDNNNCIREAFPPFSWHISDIQHQQYTMWDSRIQALQRRYFQFLLAEKKLTLALYFASELRSREMLDSVIVAAESQEGDRARFVAAVARAAYDLTASVTVGFV